MGLIARFLKHAPLKIRNEEKNNAPSFSKIICTNNRMILDFGKEIMTRFFGNTDSTYSSLQLCIFVNCYSSEMLLNAQYYNDKCD